MNQIFIYIEYQKGSARRMKMKKENVQEQSKFLLAEYKACLENGLSETPEQFLMRMDVDTKVSEHVLANLKQMKNFYDEKNK